MSDLRELKAAVKAGQKPLELCEGGMNTMVFK
jgi:hypothetical protein